MPTLLEIYESFHNGQKVQFARQVREYGVYDFAKDTETETDIGILTDKEACKMLRSFMMLEGLPY